MHSTFASNELLVGSQSGRFSSAASVNNNQSSFRNKPKSNVVRSQHFRPHTPSICNRNNDTEEMKLADELIREKTEQRATTHRALPWRKMSPRFQPKPPRKSSERYAPCCDIGCEEYFQDRTNPSSRRKNCMAFLAPSRDTPVNTTRAGSATNKEQDEVFGQIRRMEELCRHREELRKEASSKLAAAEEAVYSETRPGRGSVTPRRSFQEFEEEMKMYQEAATWISESEKKDNEKEEEEGKGKEVDDADESSLHHDESTASAAANPEEGEKDQQNQQQQQSTEDPSSSSFIPQRPPTDPILQKFYYDRVSDYDAVRRLQDKAVNVLSSRVRAGNTALRIRDHYSAAAHDPTSYSNPVTPRSKTVRMVDPSSEHSSRTSRGKFKSASESEIDAIAGGMNNNHGSHNNRDENNGYVSSANHGNQPFYEGARTGHGTNRGGGISGNYCRQAFYDVPVEVFRHVVTPRLTPRSHSELAIQKRNEIEHQRLVAAGKIASHSSSSHRHQLQNNIDSYDNDSGDHQQALTRKQSLQAAVAASLAKRNRKSGGSNARRNTVATYALADAPVLRSRVAESDSQAVLYRQIDPHLNCGLPFEKQSGRERRPLSAGAVTHTGFSIGLTFDTLRRSDTATGRGSSRMGCVPMKLPLHEKKDPPQPKLQCFPKYGQVHPRPPSVAFGSPPKPRSPTIIGSPEKVIGKEEAEEIAKMKIEPPIRTLGAFMRMNACFDFREPLDVDRGIRVTHPKSVRDIRMPVIKKKEDHHQDAAGEIQHHQIQEGGEGFK